ncbi:phytanoyl-CoA dioxygenase family protein [Paraburkholderia tropica]|uniref:phytanoyl-CoA dioxygenase family protein n=1 Tax=Paraburkholderia tropica TaxID=92647 RepID=UPI0032B56D34
MPPSLTSTSPASPFAEHHTQYWQRGYTVISGLYTSAQLDSFRRESERLWKVPGLDDDLNLRTEFRRDTQDTYVLDRLDPVLDLSPVLASAAMAPSLLEALSALLGGRCALLKCKLIRKDPGTRGYAPHQDFLYWRWLDAAPERLCSVAISLFDTDERSGGIGFYPSQHQTLIPGPSGNPEGDCDIARLDTSISDVPLLKGGDVLVFHSLAPHFSGPNLGNFPRTVLLPSYCLTDEHGLYDRYYEREISRRCREMVGFERYFTRTTLLQRVPQGSVSVDFLSRS